LPFKNWLKDGAKWIASTVAAAIVTIFATRYWENLEQFVQDPKADMSAAIAIGIITAACAVTGFVVYLLMKRQKKGHKLSEAAKQPAAAIRKANEQPEPSLAENELMEGVWFHKKRSDDVLKDFVEQVKSEYIVIATTFGKFGYAEYRLREVLAKKATLSFYVLEPDAETLPAAQSAKLVARNTRAEAVERLVKFCDLRKELSKDDQRRFRLFKYKEPPIHSMMIIDPQSDHAMLQIESYLYDTDEPLEQRPSLVISKAKQPELFDNYYRTARWIIDHSVQHDCDRV
jgi:hypothetical protein